MGKKNKPLPVALGKCIDLWVKDNKDGTCALGPKLERGHKHVLVQFIKWLPRK